MVGFLRPSATGSFLLSMSSLFAWTSRKLSSHIKGPLLLQVNMRLQRTQKKAAIMDGSIKKCGTVSNGHTDDENKSKQETEGDFSNFRITSKTIKKLKERDITHLFPIQAKTYDLVYDGNDVIARAKTGTGKTLSFALPLCEKLRETPLSNSRGRLPAVLTLAPTRELAIQTYKEFELIKSKKLSSICVYGGVSYDSQENAFRSGLDILVGTPGRIFDHIEKGNLDLSQLKHVVLDEADRMLEMGFQEKVDEILKNAYTGGNKPQTLLFSATMPSWVKKASKKYMNEDKEIVDLVGEAGDQTASGVEHKALRCPYHERASTIADIVQVYSGAHGRAMIFTSTKKEANELALNSVIKQETQVLHGDINQAQREITLASFREGKIRVLVATDVASRGLDIPEVDLVIQTEPPADIESYIHRAGRTGRAGRKGICIVFYKPNQDYLVQAVEKQAKISFTRIGAPQPSEIIKASAKDALRSLETVSPDIACLFESSAKELLSKSDPVEVLSKALALVSGNTEITSRSLLSSQQGYTTFLIRQNWALRGTGLIWKMLNEDNDETVTGQIRGMRLCKDKLAAVFDVPSSLKDTIKNNWRERHFATLETPTTLPELEERKNDFQQTNRNGYSNGNRGGYGQGRYGNQESRGFKRSAGNDNNRNDRKRTKYGSGY